MSGGLDVCVMFSVEKLLNRFPRFRTVILTVPFIRTASITATNIKLQQCILLAYFYSQNRLGSEFRTLVSRGG